MPTMPTSQGGEPKAGETTTISTNTGMETRAHHYEFRRWTTELTTGL